MLKSKVDSHKYAWELFDGAPIVMFINIYAGEFHRGSLR